MDFNYFNLLTGTISIVEDDKDITVKGIQGKVLVDAMFNAWRSNKISQAMFSNLGRTQVKFDKFFLLDVIYTLDTLIKSDFTRGQNRRIINKVLEALKNTPSAKQFLSDTFPPSIINYNQLRKMDVTLFDYQMKFLEVYSAQTQKLKLNGYLLSAKPGSGKTINSLALMECLDCDTIICIVPKKSINTVWQTTFDTVYHDKQTYFISDGKHSLQPGLQKYVFHYESLESCVSFVEQHRDTMGKVGIILDECHNFNEINSDRTQRFINLCTGNGKFRSAENVLWMSGTPLKALGKEVIPLIKTIDRNFSPAAEKAFVQIFGKNAGRALDILAHRLNLISYKVEKIDAIETQLLKEKIIVKMPNAEEYTLPKIKDRMVKFIAERTKYYESNMAYYVKNYFDCIEEYRRRIRTDAEAQALDLYLKDTAEIRKNYDPIIHKDISMACNNFEKKTIIPLLSPESKHVFRKAKSVYKYYNLTIAGECLGTVLGKARSQCNVDVARALMDHCTYQRHNGEKIETNLPEIINNGIKKSLLFTSTVAVVEETVALLKANGFTPVAVYGDTNKDLKANIDKFHKDDAVNPCVATFPSLSEAVPVTAANQVIMLNAPYRFIHWDQAVRRAYRIGQTENVYAIDVVLDTGKELNITTRGVDIMKWSEEQVAILMGDKKMDIGSMEGFEPVYVNKKKYNFEIGRNREFFKELIRSNALEEFYEKDYVQSYDCSDLLEVQQKNKLLDW